MLALQGLGDVDYSSWPCANCANVVDEMQQESCIASCGTNVVDTSSQNAASTASSLPSGAQPSSIPGIVEPQGTTTVKPATNWWRIGLAALLGLGAGYGLYRYAQRRV